MQFTFAQKVLFKHCDPAGLVFYPRYFEMLNDCVEAFFDQIGHPFETLHADNAVPTVQISATFPNPSRHGDQLAMVLQLAKLGRTSAAIDVTAHCQSDLRAAFQSTLVFIDGQGKPLPWPDPLRGALRPYLKGTD